MRKILITGTCGFIGFHLVSRLMLTPNSLFQVVGFDNINDYYPTTLKYDRLKELGINQEDIVFSKQIQSSIYSNFKFVRMDLINASDLTLLFQQEKFDIVIHLAAQAGVRYSIENPKSYIDSNIVGFLNILESCRHARVKHLIYASSSSIYGMNEKQPFSIQDRVDNPVSLYAASKKSNELMAHAYSHLYAMKTTGLRFFTVYGPWGRPDMAPFLFADAIANQKPINVFNNGKLQRDFTFVEDVVEGIYRIANQSFTNINPYQLYNIGNGKPVELLYFIECMEKAFGIKAIKHMLPMQPGDVLSTWADTSDLKAITGYQPATTIEEGVIKFVNWYKNYFKIAKNTEDKI